VGLVVAIYKSKPILVEAIQYTGDNISELIKAHGRRVYLTNYNQERVYIITTDNGDITFKPGQWIVKEGFNLDVYDDEDFHKYFEKATVYFSG
jgi:hypothetical protein